MPRSRRGGRARRDHDRLMRSLTRARTVVGALGFVPLIFSVACADRVGGLCVVPWEWYLLIWAGVIGAWLGLTIRIVRERRNFERAQR